MQYSVIIADDEPITRMDIAQILIDEGCVVLGQAKDGFDAIELARRLKPDIVLMDIKMPLFDGLAASRIIVEEETAKAIILLTAFKNQEMIDEATRIGVAGYIVKPIDEKSLLPAMAIAVSKSKQIKKLHNEIDDLSKKLDDRKVIEHAKAIIMEKLNISDTQAYSTLRKLSMDKQISMAKVANMIVSGHM